jgi:hypothetical protein
MALRIEYIQDGEVVMMVPCPADIDIAKKNALAGFDRFGADTARILDMDDGGRVIEVLKRG